MTHAAPPPAPPRVDAHLHLWQVARGDYGWLTPDLVPLYRDFGPADATPLLEAAAMDAVILVQAAPTVAETRFLLATAARMPKVAGVVGWIDMTAADAAATLEDLAGNPALRGIRPMWQDLPDDDFMHRPEIQPLYRQLAERGLRFDALARQRHLPLMPRLLERHHDLTIILDHGAKPDIAGGGLAAWRRDLRPVAAFPHVWCKLSGLVTEAAPGADAETLRPYVETLLELFGPQRLIFGSDWPVVTLRRSYAEWLAMAEALTAGLTDADRGRIFGGNAVEAYGLAGRPG